MRLSEIVTGPTKDAVSLEEIKSFCRVPVTDTDHDTFLLRLNEECTSWLERVLGICCQEQTWKVSLDCPPSDGYIQLSMGPLISITQFKYYTQDNVAHDFDSSDYFVIDGTRSVIELKTGIYWPSNLRYHASILVEWKAGFTSIVPPDVRYGIKKLVKYIFENGEDESEQSLDFRSQIVSALTLFNRNLGFDPPEYEY